MTATTPYFVPQEPGRWRALTLAAVVHAALFTFLWLGVRWQNETPIAIEAEVWSPQVREAAPRPEPEPEVKPEPQPVIKHTPKPVVASPPVAKPDIALEKEKKRKAQQQKEREEEARIEKDEADKLAKKKREAEDLKHKEAADKKREAVDKKRKEAAEAQRLAKARDEEMRRITGGVTGTGGTGTAPKTQGSRGSAEYAGRVGAKIKSHTVFNVPDNLPGNPSVEYAVELLPDGSIRRPIRKTKPSGVPGFDEAVLNAIEKSQPYPPDKSGTVPAGFNIVHRPKDQ